MINNDWIGYIGEGEKRKLVSFEIPDSVKNDPNSFYNSPEGLEIRKKSKKILENLTKKNK